MTGIASLPRDIQKLADAKGWEEDDLLDLLESKPNQPLEG